MRILIVEDEKSLALPLAQLLREKNYEVECVFDGQDGFDYGRDGSYDAIILDIMLPRKSGLQVLGELREAGVATPVLMLTALGENEDIVTGLDKGADDYLTKPFSSSVLVARLRAITRRKDPMQTKNNALYYAGTSLFMEDLVLQTDEGRRVSLSRKEALVMEYLMRNAPLACDKQAIIVSAWGFETEAQDNNVEVYVSFLRKKLLHINSSCHIETVRGIGYRLEEKHV